MGQHGRLESLCEETHGHDEIRDGEWRVRERNKEEEEERKRKEEGTDRVRMKYRSEGVSAGSDSFRSTPRIHPLCKRNNTPVGKEGAPASLGNKVGLDMTGSH
jgi:hypothetical protein